MTLAFQQDAPGTVVVEAANTPRHGVYISKEPPSANLSLVQAASELQEAESALMTALATSK